MDWRNAYPKSRGFTRDKLWSAVRQSRAQKKFEDLSCRLSKLSLRTLTKEGVTTFAAPGISSLMSDTNGLIIANNCGFSLMTGYGPDDMAGKNCKLLQMPDDPRNNQAKDAMRKAFREQLPVVTILFNVTKQGHEFCTLLDIRPIFEFGRLRGYYSLQACLEKQMIPPLLPAPTAHIIFIGDDSDFFELLKRWSKPMLASAEMKFPTDTAFRASVILIDNARINVCLRFRQLGITCPIFILTPIHQPLNRLCTEVTGVFNKQHMTATDVRHMLRVSGQHIPTTEMPPEKPIVLFDRVHVLEKWTDNISKIITDENETLVLKSLAPSNLIARLEHPCIVQFRGKVDSKTLWEYLPMDFEEYVSQHGPPGMAFLEPIQKAIAYLHDHGIVHRQIAAEHVFTGTTPKLGGLRLCKYIDLGRTMTHVGIPEYVAPEVMLNKGYDKSVDAWAFGVLAYFAQVGSLPFQAETPLELYSSMYHFHSEWPLINSLLQIDGHKRPHFTEMQFRNNVTHIRIYKRVRK